MGKTYLRLLLVVLGIGFSIFFGVDLATRGVERVHGPITGQDAAIVRPLQPAAPVKQPEGREAGAAGKTQTAAKQADKEAKDKAASEAAEPRKEITEASGINRFGNKVGELLQIITYHGIRWFVALFDAITE
ncbi:hypothetical protein SK3146_06255 [Paenibacillus konkukensis]|uniref:Uncharacterized protein n=1 Tax=Paenibacillus konkukensis TaxID=2020716 RepID=A0ABY4S089_9BACL|nr:hypothetical protein [Paenibacillus konkukensis]UQZ86962.1 hypothetical protein SK3146_06255 [Paenibacillus konkukensis]